MTPRPAVKTRCRPRGYLLHYRPQRKTSELLADVGQVLDEYRRHWPLTVRQVFYRLVGAHGYPKSEAFYERLCEHMANARRARVIPFDAIRDDGISVIAAEHYESIDAFWGTVRSLARNYRRDKLASQDIYIEVWCEAAGMQPQLAAVAEDYSISVYSSSGFDSLTAKYHLAQRICRASRPATVLHLGDYDPSGESIFTALTEDVRAFVLADRLYAGIDISFRRVALTAGQISALHLPSAPPKASDSRSARWGSEKTCQLEALAPDQIAEVLRSAIETLIDGTLLEQDIAAERWERQQIAYALPAGGVR